MVRLARELWPTWRGDDALPADDASLVRGVLDAIADEHQAPGDLLDFCREENARIEAFCAERDLIGLVDEPLDIRWTPVFLRAYGGAMLISPGPLDKGLTTFFAITPIPEDWSPEQARVVPSRGQRPDAPTARRSTKASRATISRASLATAPVARPIVFESGIFAEGWAVYVTQVMMDVGYGADDPALLLVHWKFYLRSITNAMIDARIHCDGMTEDEAVRLMVEDGFQEEAEARAKFERARLSSTQLSTYFAGSMEMWDIELEARRRAAAAIGADASTCDRGALPGGFGETPGFVYRDHLEAVIGHGAPPTSLLKRILFD